MTTALVMISTEVTAVIAVLIDGIIASQLLGEDVYAGISLLRPFISMLLVLAGFLSTGCTAVCSKLVTQGRRDEANGVFHLATLLALAGSVASILFCLLFPSLVLRLCGVPLDRSSELVPYMYEYLHGYLTGIAPLLLIQVAGPILVIDGDRRIFTVSSIVLCASDIIGDLLNVFVFHKGAFGMGIATSIGYVMQFLVILFAFIFRKGYFQLSLRRFNPSCLKDLAEYGIPTLFKSIAETLRDVLLNYINIIVAISFIAVAARGIQSDISQLLLCIPIGLGGTLNTMASVYYSAKDRIGLQRPGGRRPVYLFYPMDVRGAGV